MTYVDCVCGYCKKSFSVSLGRFNKGRGEKFCTHRCYGNSLRGKPLSPTAIAARTKAHLGRKNTPETKLLMRESALRRIARDGVPYGEDNHQWKGDKASRTALHNWVKRNLGKPMECEFCGFTSNNPCMINWANKSQQYKRDLSDWLRLCRKCHHAYDDISTKAWITKRKKVT